MTGGSFSLLTIGSTLNTTMGELSTTTACVYQVKCKIGSGTFADSIKVTFLFDNPPSSGILVNRNIIN